MGSAPWGQFDEVNTSGRQTIVFSSALDSVGEVVSGKGENERHSGRLAAVERVVQNVKRLIADANLLLRSGSPGSSLSLAILAFEEAGKGHVLELGVEKPPKFRSHHEFRHRVAALVLHDSLMQKYGLGNTKHAEEIREYIRENTVRVNKRSVLPPMSDELRKKLREEAVPRMKKLSDSEAQLLGIEIRWLAKIAKAAGSGDLEKLRQAGLYVDAAADFSIVSSPDSINPMEAARWIWAASSVLALLEHGAFYQAYSPLSEAVLAEMKNDRGERSVEEIVRSMAGKVAS